MRLNFKRLGLLAGKAARVFAAEVGLTPQRLDLLRLVRAMELTQRQIAERLCVSRPVISRMLAALERDGLVVRERDRDDPRAKVTYLTRDGEERVAAAFGSESKHGAQATGEAIWLDEWRWRIAPLGLRLDCVLRARAPNDFAALARWNREYVPKPAGAPPTPKPADSRDPVLVELIESLGVDYEAWARGEWGWGQKPGAPTS